MGIKSEELCTDNNPKGGFMKKTFVMFFLLGLMVSCASQQDRSLSSVDEPFSHKDEVKHEMRGSYR